jgi:glycine cleavage system aminomethyltransferase T
MYGIVHPAEQWQSDRDVRRPPFHAREHELGAVFHEVGGWERPHYYGSNERLLGEYGDRVGVREAEWDSRWWSPIIDAEHLALRDRAAMIDLSAFVIFDVTGPGALDVVQRLALRQMDVAVGRVVYTPLLTPGGGFRSDLVIMRLEEQRFRVVTGAAHGRSDLKWFGDHLPRDGSAALHDQTSAWCTLGVWGPRARDILSAVTSDDVSHEGFPFAHARTIEIGSLCVIASRISYVGELGWELHAPFEQGAALWDAIAEAGAPHGIVPAGIGVYGTTARLEKCYRAHGLELDTDYNPVEAGMAGADVKAQDFIGRSAHLRHRAEDPAALLCTLTVDDHTSASGARRFMLGGEPILTREGGSLSDRRGRRSFATSAGAGPSIGRHILMSYLPPEHAHPGAALAVEYMGERYPVTVEVVGATPIFDPQNGRIRR